MPCNSMPSLLLDATRCLSRNPATGESIKIAASKRIAFRPAMELKETV
jgi:nucleoid DNA-binding protein